MEAGFWHELFSFGFDESFILVHKFLSGNNKHELCQGSSPCKMFLFVVIICDCCNFGCSR